MSELPQTSITAYKELREEGTIRDRQKLAFNTVRLFHQQTGLWPTQREAHVFLVEELDLLTVAQRLEAITEGYAFIGRRLGELKANPDDEFPDVLVTLEKREHTYLAENHPGADSGRKAEPYAVKRIVNAQ